MTGEETVLKSHKTSRTSADRPSPSAALPIHPDHHRAFLDGTQDAVIIHDLHGRVVYWNKAAERIYGWPYHEIVGRHLGEFVCRDAGAFHEKHEYVLKHGEWTGEGLHLTRDRREIIVESHWTLLKDLSGNPHAVIGMNTDVSRQREMELELNKARRMASLGVLAGGIAHDFNNVLTPIMLSIESLKKVVADAEISAVLDTIEASARRGSEIVRQVISLDGRMEGQSIPVRPRYLAREVEHIIRDIFPANIRISFSLAADIGTMRGDPTQLQQVLLNLCLNARDAMPKGGVLEVKMDNCAVDEHFVAMNAAARPGNYLRLTVGDTGDGMPPEIVERIFDPFFTTKGPGKGTGLGLCSVRTIIENHDGFITVASTPGKGTTFKAYLPSQCDEEHEEIAVPVPDLPRGSGETILVVDDESSILSVSQHTLESFGYRFLMAENGAEAIALYAQERGRIAAILTDFSMPVMDGRATVYALKKINPDVKIILMSGKDHLDTNALANSIGIRHFLTKPYTAATLLRTLRDVIAG
jgi:PAS domain S-box-containing protein